MPTISITETGEMLPSVALAANTYYSETIVVPMDARARGAKEVIPGEMYLLEAANNTVVWTDSLQSCFPVVFKFSNGDIGLYHANGGTFDDRLHSWLNNTELTDIQLFEKPSKALTSDGRPKPSGHNAKVQSFAQSLITHFQSREHQPNLSHASSDYGVAVCYKATDGKPIIFVGKSGDGNIMATGVDDCSNKVDVVVPHHLAPIAAPDVVATLQRIRADLHESKEQSVPKDALVSPIVTSSASSSSSEPPRI